VVSGADRLTTRRRAGYRLLGRGFDYLLHLRPAEWPIMAAHTALGYLLAVGVRGAAAGERIGPAALGLLLWVVCLNGGTLAINSAFDRDEGDIAYLRNPPPPPRGLFAFGFGLMVLGLAAAAVLLPRAYAAAYAVCLAMSVLYSVPPVRLKAVAGADWLINMWGFGSFTPFAGWAATGLAVYPAGRWVLLAFCPLFAALYPLTQLYQLEEDERRGDSTLARILGVDRSLAAARAAACAAFALFAAGALRAGWRWPADWLRWAGLAIAALAWALVLVPWSRRAHRMTPDEHQQGMHRALAAWALTDLVVVLGWGA
jgi:4-hydroxybenzoate polyprenyltransferase